MRVDFEDIYWLTLFENPDTGLSVTVTKKRFVDMLKEAFSEDSEDFQSFIFMQDRATAHTLRLALIWMEMTFLDRLISNKSDFMWPPRSKRILGPSYNTYITQIQKKCWTEKEYVKMKFTGQGLTY